MQGPAGVESAGLRGAPQRRWRAGTWCKPENTSGDVGGLAAAITHISVVYCPLAFVEVPAMQILGYDIGLHGVR